MTFIKEPDVKIRFDETSQFAEGSANVSVTTFLGGLQKLQKIGRPRGSGLKLQTSAETNGDQHIQLEMVHTNGYRTGDEYIRVPRGQEKSTYDKRRVHTSA